MRVTPSRIAGAFLVHLALVEDERGWFSEVHNAAAFAGLGTPDVFVRTALSFNRRAGTLRGLHFQRAPRADAKLITCVSGRLFDVVADVRKGSPTFGLWQGYALDAGTPCAVYLPAGVAHGFQTLVDDTTVLYHIGAYYDRGVGTGVRWDDPALAVSWPLPVTVLSAADASLPLLSGA